MPQLVRLYSRTTTLMPLLKCEYNGKMLLEKIKPILDFFFPPKKLDEAVRILTAEQLLSRSVLFEKDNILAFFRYDDELVRHMIWKLKYHGDVSIADLFAECVNDVLTEELSDRALFHGFAEPLLVPIPLSKKRLRARRYNQATLLARALEAQAHIPNTSLAEALVKIRDTAPQTTLSKEQRITNLKGVFAINRPQTVRNKNILLIDDVTTTGSTLREARRVLEKAGARCVVCLAIAH